jgi:Flp pilus assembly protein TadD
MYIARALRANPSSIRLISALATVFVQQTRYPDAAQLAERAVRLHPQDMEAQRLYLRVLVLNHDAATARPLARKLLAAAPHDFNLLYLNGMLEREAGEYAIARDHLEEAVALDPSNDNCRYNLGVALAQLKDPKGAKEQFEKALELGATEPQVRFELAAVLRTLGENAEADTQLQRYQQEMQANVRQTLANGKSAQAAEELAAGNAQKAVDLYREAVEAAPNDAVLVYKMALALDQTGDTAAERTALEQAVKMDPTLALAQNQLGYLASREGDSATAEQHFRLAVGAAPGYTEAWVSLAATLGMESRFSEAQQAVGTALQLDPHNEQALHLRQELIASQGSH